MRGERIQIYEKLSYCMLQYICEHLMNDVRTIYVFHVKKNDKFLLIITEICLYLT